MGKPLAGALALALFTPTAFAHTCPALMSEIDEALQDQQTLIELGADELGELRDLRERGERLHEQGDHEESVTVLNEARSMLGLD